MKHKIYYRREISAAHRLDLPYKSKCNNIHGHNYLIEIWVNGTLDKQGMVIDFSNLKKITNQLDHHLLNNIIGGNPTVERMCTWIYNKILLEYPNIENLKVRIWEDKDSYAEVEV